MHFKSIAICALVGVLSLFASAPTGVAPASAFTVPTAEAMSQNPQYWLGYQTGEQVAVPLPEGTAYDSFAAYQGAIQAMYLPQTSCPMIVCIYKTVNNYNVGYDNALMNAATYFWLNDPQSCHNVVCQ